MKRADKREVSIIDTDVGDLTKAVKDAKLKANGVEV